MMNGLILERLSQRKVLHVIKGKLKSERPNGVCQVTNNVLRELWKQRLNVTALCKSHLDGKKTLRREHEDGYEMLIIGRNLIYHLIDITTVVKKAEIIHIHGVYSPYLTIVALICMVLKKKYIISPHGGLRPKARETNSKQKNLYDWTVQRHIILNAAGIHSFSRIEAKQICSDYKTKIENNFIIPNGIESARIRNYSRVYEDISIQSPHVDFAYIGRFSAEKNLEVLCESFCSLRKNCKEAKLTLYGPDNALKTSLERKFRSRNIIFKAAVYGDEKYACIDKHQVFVLPSLNEGMPIAALEIFARGKILIASHECNLEDLGVNVYAFFCGTETLELLQSLIEVTQASGEMLREVRLNAWNLAKNHLTWEMIAKKYRHMYRCI